MHNAQHRKNANADSCRANRIHYKPRTSSYPRDRGPPPTSGVERFLSFTTLDAKTHKEIAPQRVPRGASRIQRQREGSACRSIDGRKFQMCVTLIHTDVASTPCSTPPEQRGMCVPFMCVPVWSLRRARSNSALNRNQAGHWASIHPARRGLCVCTLKIQRRGREMHF